MSKLRHNDVKTKEREFIALTSLTLTEFELLVEQFERAFQEHMRKWRLDGKPRGKRSYTMYKNSPLPTPEDRLLFVLSYVKINPLQSNHGILFGIVKGKTNQWLHALLPALQDTFRALGVAPSRSVQELAERLGTGLAEEEILNLESDTPLPLFAMTAQNSASSAPKMKLNRANVVAESRKRTR